MVVQTKDTQHSETQNSNLKLEFSSTSLTKNARKFKLNSPNVKNAENSSSPNPLESITFSYISCAGPYVG